jgi:hypothetical protein
LKRRRTNCHIWTEGADNATNPDPPKSEFAAPPNIPSPFTGGGESAIPAKVEADDGKPLNIPSPLARGGGGGKNALCGGL